MLPQLHPMKCQCTVVNANQPFVLLYIVRNERFGDVSQEHDDGECHELKEQILMEKIC